MPVTTRTDKIRARSVDNHLRLIREHLEAMQRDAHGLGIASGSKGSNPVNRVNVP